MNENSTYPIKLFISDVWGFISPYRARFVLATLLRLSGDIALLYPTYAFAQIVNLLVVSGHEASATDFWRLIILWGCAEVWRYTATSSAKYLCFQISERSSLDLGIEAIRHLSQLDISWHEAENSGSKLKRIQRGVDALDQLVRIWIANIIEISVSFVGMVVIVAQADIRIGAALFIFLITYTPLSLFLLRAAAQSSRRVSLQEENVQGLFFEILNNIRSVKLMGIAFRLIEKLKEKIEYLIELIADRIYRFQSRAFYLGVYANLFRVAFIGIIGYGILRGHYEVGFLVLFNGYFSNLRGSAEELSNISENITTSKYSIARVMEILREPVIIDSEEGKLPLPINWKEIKIKKLSFGYGANRVLENISFSIRRGEKIGIVGLSGAGKSTLFKLLLKEHENYDGGIYFDNVALQKISRKDYLRQVAVVLQETEVFNFSLQDNVMIAAENDSDVEAFNQAIQVAHVKDFVPKLPEGVNTLIGEKGMKLSGGEKQRLGIARAIVKKPQILFLDEATSHLDLESEKKIQDSLAKFFETVTAVVIAHRLTTIRKMDRILVIEDGRIVESGSFNELMKKEGRFFELWEKQKL